jgi:mono/diheme cytochrome c family protein
MKNKIFKTIALVFSSVFFLSIMSGFSTFQKKPWPVPDNYKKMKNAVPSNAESIANGKTLYSTHCKSCHGSKGLGDGSKAAQLKTEPGDFSSGDFQSQPDGAIFYKTSEGRDDMPSFKKKLADDEDRWALVNYLRTLKK